MLLKGCRGWRYKRSFMDVEEGMNGLSEENGGE